jgi:hypothetical protein
VGNAFNLVCVSTVPNLVHFDRAKHNLFVFVVLGGHSKYRFEAYARRTKTGPKIYNDSRILFDQLLQLCLALNFNYTTRVVGLSTTNSYSLRLSTADDLNINWLG